MKVTLLVLGLIVSTLASSANRVPLHTVDYVDIQRYLGKWYEIARFDQKFQKGCTATSATYTLRKDGDIAVKNECRLNNPNGKQKVSYGRAWVVDTDSNAKLKVQFFLKRFKIPFLAGNYWILELGDNYEYAIIGDPSREYLWFLSRTKTISERLYSHLINRAQDMNFDTTKLIRTSH